MPASIRLLVRCRVADTDAVSDALTAAGYGALWVDEPLAQHTDDDGYVLDAPDPNAPATVHAYPTDSARTPKTVPTRAAGYAVEAHAAEDDTTDWNTAWRESHASRVEISPGWVLVPPWDASDSSVKKGERAIVMEPAGAFGTGEHPTTRACLRMLFELLPTGGAVLDLGAGSGILSIAAVLWGAGRVLAVDVQENTGEIIAHGAGMNGLAAGRVEFVCRDAAEVAGEQNAGERWDVVLCNVGAAEVLRVIAHAGPGFRGAAVILSGVFEPSRARVSDAARSRGWSELKEHTEEGWVTSAWRVHES